jgi:hypothetical protein
MALRRVFTVAALQNAAHRILWPVTDNLTFAETGSQFLREVGELDDEDDVIDVRSN